MPYPRGVTLAYQRQRKQLLFVTAVAYHVRLSAAIV